jgi:hypothetical protein
MRHLAPHFCRWLEPGRRREHMGYESSSTPVAALSSRAATLRISATIHQLAGRLKDNPRKMSVVLATIVAGEGPCGRRL